MNSNSKLTTPLVALALAFVWLPASLLITSIAASGAPEDTVLPSVLNSDRLAASPIVSQFTVPGSSPRGLAWDGSRLWLVDNLKNVYQLDTAGNVLSTFPITFTPSGMTWDGASLWIGDDDNYRQVRLDTSGNLLGTMNVWYWWDSGIAWDGANFWIGDYNFSEIHKHTSSGAQLLFWELASASEIEHPTGMAYDGANLWIGDPNEGFGNNVERFSTTGQLLDSFDTNAWGIPPVSWPEYKCLAWDGQYLWYSADDLFTVYRIDVASLYKPSITSVTSKTSKPGKPATINGVGFSATKTQNTAKFGKYTAAVKSATTKKLTVTIPSQCRSGKSYGVQVTVNGKKSNTVQFKVK